MPVWYPALSGWSFPTSFVPLRQQAVDYLAADDAERAAFDDTLSVDIIRELGKVMNSMSGAQFVSVDDCSPTDTERFETKGGSCHSAKSAWKYICCSEKIRSAAKAGRVNFLCVRPFRRITQAREFRLFVINGKLAAMSQYNLIRHYYRLDGVKEEYLALAEKFVSEVAWRIPLDRVVIDIYITGSKKVMVIDLNKWGSPTDPKMLKTWDRDWSESAGIVLMDIPRKISGDVNVSF